MDIFYCPSYLGETYIDLGERNLRLNAQVLETQGLLEQLALHAGIHQNIRPFPERLADYHNALLKYDETCPENIFHKSLVIDSLNVAKTLLKWRDALSLAGWKSGINGISKRLNSLSEIEKFYSEASDIANLLRSVECATIEMKEGRRTIPAVYKDITIYVPCEETLLPDYLNPLFTALKQILKNVTFGTMKTDDMPQKIKLMHFSQQYQAEAWLSQQDPKEYDVWINTDNKRLDNWLHMSGKAVGGSCMRESNPQITQIFLLSVQLFQRPLNVNTLLQYLYLPESPLPWDFKIKLASAIVDRGGFHNDLVLDVFKAYLEENNNDDWLKYLPFDLRDENQAKELTVEKDDVDINKMTAFLKNLRGYAGQRANKLAAVKPHDLRIAQLQQGESLLGALLQLLENQSGSISFNKLQQWSQSLYDSGDFKQYNAQVGCQYIINNPADMVSKAKRVIWCDLYGDVPARLSTDFLSPRELKSLRDNGVKLWNPDNEANFLNLMMATPLHMTTDEITFVVCDRQGMTVLPTHPLKYQLPKNTELIDGDKLFSELPPDPAGKIDNSQDSESVVVKFDSETHSFEWRKTESYSSLDSLINNPYDYFMKYILKFSDLGSTEIKMSSTLGNVAHEVIEKLFTSELGAKTIISFVRDQYDEAFQSALSRRGALLLLPEHHLIREVVRHQLERCVNNLAEIILDNRLTVQKCEQEESEDLNFWEGVKITGYIDMVLEDPSGNEVVFDLKWTSKKDKFQDLLRDNKAAQLAIYKAMLMQHKNHPQAVRTAFFVMPMGKIVSTDEFLGAHYEHIDTNNTGDLMDHMRDSYRLVREEITGGTIMMFGNEYSDYNCFKN